MKHANPVILNPYIKNKEKPYLSIDVFIDDIKETYLVHRLVAKHFLTDSYDESKDVHHKDGNKLNNSSINLIVLSKDEHIKLHSNKNNGNL